MLVFMNSYMQHMQSFACIKLHTHTCKRDATLPLGSRRVPKRQSAISSLSRPKQALAQRLASRKSLVRSPDPVYSRTGNRKRQVYCANNLQTEGLFYHRCRLRHREKMSGLARTFRAPMVLVVRSRIWLAGSPWQDTKLIKSHGSYQQDGTRLCSSESTDRSTNIAPHKGFV